MNELDRIACLTDTVGESEFDSAYFDVFDELLDLWSCTAFEFRRHSPPRCIVAAATNKEGDARVRYNAERYVKRGYKDDPNLRYVESQDTNDIQIRSLADAKFDDDSYRARYFGRASTRDKIFILSAGKNRVIYANFYRGNFQPCFSEADKQLLEKYAKLCISVLNRHIVFGAKSMKKTPKVHDEPVVRREVRFQQVQELILRYGISPREAEICAMIVVGYTSEGIGADLGISKNTVITHRRRAYEKLGISNQNELFAKCFDSLSLEN